jgi:cytochrome P450
MRVCERETKICGTVIPKHTIVHIPIKMIHYQSRYWESAQEFNPDRSVSECGGSGVTAGLKRGGSCTIFDSPTLRGYHW